MYEKNLNPKNITGKINIKALELLEQNPNGIQWTNLNAMIQKSESTFHPKTVNGCVWKLTERFPDKVYKPSKGLFKLLKYKETVNTTTTDNL
jgi:hypothetical protein